MPRSTTGSNRGNPIFRICANAGRARYALRISRFRVRPIAAPAEPTATVNSDASSQPGNPRVARKSRLRVETDWRIDGAESFVSPALDDFEKEQVLEAFGVKLKVFATVIRVVEHVVVLQQLQPRRIETGTRFKIVVVILRNAQSLYAVCLQPRGCGEDVVGGKGDVLHAGAEILVEEARRLCAWALRGVERDPQHPIHGLDNLAANDAAGIGYIDLRRFPDVK